MESQQVQYLGSQARPFGRGLDEASDCSLSNRLEPDEAIGFQDQVFVRRYLLTAHQVGESVAQAVDAQIITRRFRSFE